MFRFLDKFKGARYTRQVAWFYCLTTPHAAMLCRSLLPRHGASLGCGWKRRPPDVEGSCEYIE